MTNGGKTIESDFDYSKNEGKGNVMWCHFWWTWVYLYLLKIFGALREWEDGWFILQEWSVCDWKAETSYTFRWLSIVQALLKNSLYICSFQFQAPLLPQLISKDVPVPGCVCVRGIFCAVDGNWLLISTSWSLIHGSNIMIYLWFTHHLQTILSDMATFEWLSMDKCAFWLRTSPCI